MRSVAVVALVLTLSSAVIAHKVPLLRRRHAPSLNHRRTINSDTLFSYSSIVAPLYIGTPAQEIFVILDTSSSDLAIFSPAYTSQYHPSDSSSTSLGNAFDSSASSTFTPINQTFQNHYGSGSTQTYFEADKAQETMTLENYTLTDQMFGLIGTGNVSYGPLTSGILGLAFEAASMGIQATPLVQQLYFNGAFASPVFSFALMRPSSALEKVSQSHITQPGGIFTLGQLDSDQYQGSIGWSPLVTPSTDGNVPTKWLATLDNITVSGALVDGSAGMVANYDTGSSATRASESILDAIFAKAEDVYKGRDGSYYVRCGQDAPTGMNMTLSMGGVSVDIEPMDLLYKTQPYVTAAGDTYCLSTLSATTSTEYDIQIGDDVLRSLFVAFQYEPPRVGIAKQSVNVHNQGAMPSYAFGAVQPLNTNLLLSPSASAAMSHVSVVPVATSASDHVGLLTEAGEAITIQKGGLYVASMSRPMQTIVASSTPVQIAPTISTSRASTLPSSSASSGSSSASPLSLASLSFLVSIVTAVLLADRRAR